MGCPKGGCVMRALPQFITQRSLAKRVAPDKDPLNYGIGVRWSVWLWFVSGMGGIMTVMLTVAVIGAGLVAPGNPASVFGFNCCENAACFWGLVPGTTSWAEARAVFNGRVSYSFDTPNGNIWLYESVNEGVLGRILIQVPENDAISAGSIVRLYGPPCRVTVFLKAQKFSLRYPKVRFVTQPYQHALRTNTPVILIEFGDPVQLLQMGAPSCMAERTMPDVEAADRPWRGFASLQRYLAAQ